MSLKLEDIKKLIKESIPDAEITIKDLAGAALVLSEVSLDISPTEATEGLAALTLNLDLSIEKTDELANQIDVLSDTTLSTSGEILKTSARLSGFADALGISAAEVTGLSAALLATKQSATTVRTTLTSLFEVLTSRPFEAAEAVGFTGTAIREFANLTRTDATEAVLVFVEAFSKLDFSEQTNTLKQLEIGSKRISQVMRTFAANTERFILTFFSIPADISSKAKGSFICISVPFL